MNFGYIFIAFERPNTDKRLYLIFLQWKFVDIERFSIKTVSNNLIMSN